MHGGIILSKKHFLNLFFYLIVITLIGCGNATEYRDSFNATATISVSEVIFKAEITENYIKFTSENLTEPITYQNGQLFLNDIQAEVSPNDNSAFYLIELILEVLNSGTENGYYKNIPYSCIFNKDTMDPDKITWGNISVEFNYFE